MAETIPTSVSTTSKKAPDLMKAVEWRGTNQVEVTMREVPSITNPDDAIIKVTSTTICGSDLHLYHNEVPGMKTGDILGHEFMGIVKEVGPGVKNLKIGQRVVVSAVIADGSCWYCKQKLYSCCDTTNPSVAMEKMYGHRTAGLFGYSHLTGGYSGGQAEYARVPYAEVNCLQVPDELPDEKVLFLSDIVSTGYHATDLGEVSSDEGRNKVAVWGCGPVGLMAIAWSKFRGAKTIIAIDDNPARLQIAYEKFGAIPINCDEEKQPVEAIKRILKDGIGPDVVIDAVGFRYAKSLIHKVEKAIGLETDAIDVLSEAITAVRKGGVVSVVGDYVGYANHFPIGALMEKGLTLKGGQVHVHKYWQELLKIIREGKFDPTFLITHCMSLEEAPMAYKIFDKKEDNAIKIILKPQHQEGQWEGQMDQARRSA